MKRLLCLLALAGCAGAPLATIDAGTQQEVLPGKTTRAQLLALLGEGTLIRFEHGAEVRQYLSREGDAYREFVVLLDAHGTVVQTRSGALVRQAR